MQRSLDGMKPHLTLAFECWKQILKPSDIVIDATCGNGYDTQRLSCLVPEGMVFSLDIQEKALASAKKRVDAKNVSFLLQSHVELPEIFPVKLIVYNLGYLPKGNKDITTLCYTTLLSLKKGLSLLCPGGAISITCYSGHSEGAREERAVFDFAQTLDPVLWKVQVYEWKTIERPTHPSLFVFQKKIDKYLG